MGPEIVARKMVPRTQYTLLVLPLVDCTRPRSVHAPAMTCQHIVVFDNVLVLRNQRGVADLLSFYDSFGESSFPIVVRIYIYVLQSCVDGTVPLSTLFSSMGFTSKNKDTLVSRQELCTVLPGERCFR